MSVDYEQTIARRPESRASLKQRSWQVGEPFNSKGGYSCTIESHRQQRQATFTLLNNSISLVTHINHKTEGVLLLLLERKTERRARLLYPLELVSFSSISDQRSSFSTRRAYEILLQHLPFPIPLLHTRSIDPPDF